ncbi:unnamed protein product [Prunus armeniaca]|uniref:Ankyrin repeat domain-containing protein n=1 Tax=Prunus armeniaca TaxID=36596 RepID=A0A6J5WXM6_PRUAR|nr:unnamed protein product [Prunus armeniaca]
MSKSSATSTASCPPLKPDDYSHSPVHYAVVLADHTTLSRIVTALPRLADPTQIHTESDSLSHERTADQISAVLDRRDVPYRETPLHLAVRLNDAVSAKILASAGADVSLQNSAGWNPLQEALCRRSSDIALILLRLHHRSAWAKWRRRLPRVIAVLRRMRDFYMEISFHFESSVIPFVGKIAPSDTYKIWKRDGNLRADTSLAGFDGLKIQRADQSFLFLGDGDQSHDVPSGSLLVLNRDDRKIFDAFENAGSPMSESDIAGFCSQTSVYRPGMDVTKAELVGRTNWRRQEKTESVGEWKARVFEIHNVLFSFRSRKVANGDADVAGSEQVLPLELDEDDDGFLVAENPSFGIPDGRRHSSFVREDREFAALGRKSVDVSSMAAAAPPRRSMAAPPRRSMAAAPPRRSMAAAPPMRPMAAAPPMRPMASAPPMRPMAAAPVQTKEKEYVRSLRPSVWLTEQFPLKTEELLPLLDILANKVKAVRRMRELLTTKFPPGSFPVKVAIPVVPTVRVVITFTKFVELPPTEQFFTPMSSPRQFIHEGRGQHQHLQQEEEEEEEEHKYKSQKPSSLSSSTSWLRRSSSQSGSGSKQNHQPQRGAPPAAQDSSDPFAIPSGYTWTSIEDKSRKMRKSKSIRRSK